MSNKLLPYFSVDGKKYEIKATRYLLAEFDKLSKSTITDDDTKVGLLKGQRVVEKLQEMAKKLRDARAEFEADVLNKELRDKYKIYDEMYDEAYNEFVLFEVKNNSITNGTKIVTDRVETVLILALVEQHGLAEEEAKKLWGDYSQSIGETQTAEWLMFMHNELFTTEETEDPFLKQARAKEALKAESRKGLKMVK